MGDGQCGGGCGRGAERRVRGDGRGQQWEKHARERVGSLFLGLFGGSRLLSVMNGSLGVGVCGGGGGG